MGFLSPQVDQDDLSKKFEAIMSGSGLFMYNNTDDHDNDSIEEPKNEIISEEDHDIFNI